MTEYEQSKRVINALVAFRLAKLRIHKLGWPAVDKLLNEAEALIEKESASAKAKYHKSIEEDNQS